MTYDIFVMLRSVAALVFGIGVSLLFAGIRTTHRSRLVIALFFTLVLITQVFVWKLSGLDTAIRLYPFITHFPEMLFLILYFKRPWPISLISILTAYLCCQIPRWAGSMVSAITGVPLLDHIGYLITMCVVYYYMKRYIADSVIQLMERSTRSCLLFGLIPSLYYLFDYATTVYTNLLYSGAREIVQFTPSVICISYLLFVLLYYKESQKQEVAEREMDILAAQIQQAQQDLDTMRQMQNNTILYRHDMRHHLSLIGGFAAEGDLAKIKEYLINTEADIDAMTPVRYCENEATNLILSTFVTRAKKVSVALQINVKLPVELGISDTELCALLSNALENAIQAAAQLKKEAVRRVTICAIINAGKLVISTENPYVGGIECEGELPKSTNKAPGHGYGIKSIVAIVERHGGLYSFQTEGGVFILRILMPLGNTNT